MNVDIFELAEHFLHKFDLREGLKLRRGNNKNNKGKESILLDRSETEILFNECLISGKTNHSKVLICLEKIKEVRKVSLMEEWKKAKKEGATDKDYIGFIEEKQTRELLS